MGEQGWTANALRFPTQEQADKYAANLTMRWLAVTNWQSTLTQDPANHYWDEEMQAAVAMNMEGFVPETIGGFVPETPADNPVVMGETWPNDPGVGDIILDGDDDDEDDEELMDEEIALQGDDQEVLEQALVASAAVAEERADEANEAALMATTVADDAADDALDAEAIAEQAEDAAIQAENALDSFEGNVPDVYESAADIPEVVAVANPYLMTMDAFLKAFDYTSPTEYLSGCLDHDEPGATLALCIQTCLIDPGAYCEHGCPAAATVILAEQTNKSYDEAADLLRVAEGEPAVEVEEVTGVVEVIG
jgi:hypothetical protein